MPNGYNNKSKSFYPSIANFIFIFFFWGLALTIVITEAMATKMGDEEDYYPITVVVRIFAGLLVLLTISKFGLKSIHLGEKELKINYIFVPSSVTINYDDIEKIELKERSQYGGARTVVIHHQVRNIYIITKQGLQYRLTNQNFDNLSTILKILLEKTAINPWDKK